MATAALLLHPVRMRIVFALGGRELTTAEIAQALPDVAQATLYRQVAALAEGGIIEVVAERQARGAVERTYRVVADRAHVSAADARALSPAEHRTGFAAFIGALVADTEAYLAHPDARPGDDGFGYAQTALWADTDEIRALVDDLTAVFERHDISTPGPGRSRYTFSNVLAPTLGARDASE